jgi:osmoprotectant transport system substrate-binding protein
VPSTGPSTTTSRERLVRAVLGVLAATALATTTLTACGVVGSSEDQLGTVVVGSANFTESELLGEIYAQALEASRWSSSPASAHARRT